jgi:hypothetical protein
MSADATRRSDTCDWCGGWIGKHDATAVDDSGGALVQLCTGCRETLETDRCRFCGDTMTRESARKSVGIIFHDSRERDELAPVCDSCRNDLLRPPGQIPLGELMADGGPGEASE